MNLKVFISNLGQQAVGGTKHREARAIFKVPLAGYWTVHNLMRSPLRFPLLHPRLSVLRLAWYIIASFLAWQQA